MHTKVHFLCTAMNPTAAMITGFYPIPKACVFEKEGETEREAPFNYPHGGRQGGYTAKHHYEDNLTEHKEEIAMKLRGS